ncbi:ATP-binding cassette domain-containing protein [Lactobacillus salivarius]|uniref:ATP-binding cassette domain-containing protein n=1 Tax=Ligilactobacillus salivarius TaxID=1624 RepID=A0A6A8LUY3_9LACO|nr:ATP-binding cassette domain-containing protein [Ligilactobacillus salivarius]MSE06983.1 ATP-binding cassette domain-containing protein [Ligilactobacillus salivarius]MSE07974.1 ATP-binding cassette domain-containing protein [Ligilactobacillus salivarius]
MKRFLIEKKLLIKCIFLILLIVFTGIPIPLIIQFMFDKVIPSHNSSLLIHSFFLFVVLILSQIILNYLLSILSSKWTQKGVLSLRSKIFLSGLSKDIFHDDYTVSLIQTIIISDTEIVGVNLQKILIDGVASTISISMYILVISIIDLKVFLIISVAIPIYILINIILSNFSQKFFKKIQENKDESLGFLSDFYKGFKFIKLYNVMDLKKNKYHSIIKNMEEQTVKYYIIVTFLSSCMLIITVISPFLILVYGCYMVFNGNTSVGTVIAEYTYANAIFSPISVIIGLFPVYKQMVVSMDRIKSIEALYQQGKVDVKYKDFKDNTIVDIQNISMKNREEQYIIKNFTKKIMDKTIYLLQGKNGSGKSTLLSAIKGLYMIDSGNITIKSECKVAYVPTEVYIFSDTILNNLTMGLKEYDHSYLLKLLQITHLDKDLEKNGITIYNKINANNSLSVGQLQKIKLIRAMIDKPNVLMLDEILSNMDTESQLSILLFLKEWSKQHTVIIVSHNSELIEKNLKVKYIKL